MDRRIVMGAALTLVLLCTGKAWAQQYTQVNDIRYTEEFRKAGAQVCIIDKQEGDHFVGDIADKQTLEQFAQEESTSASTAIMVVPGS